MRQAEYRYNGDGQRVAQVVGGVETRYTLDVAAGLEQVLVEERGGVATTYLYGLGRIAAQEDGGEWRYHLHDGLGNVRAETSATGALLAVRSFSPFGEPIQDSDGGTPWGYTGEQWDGSAGLLYLRARYYSPALGRFVSKDPFAGFAARPQTLNRYAYVANNPVNFFDPSGLNGPCPGGICPPPTETPMPPTGTGTPPPGPTPTLPPGMPPTPPSPTGTPIPHPCEGRCVDEVQRLLQEASAVGVRGDLSVVGFLIPLFFETAALNPVLAVILGVIGADVNVDVIWDLQSGEVDLFVSVGGQLGVPGGGFTAGPLFIYDQADNAGYSGGSYHYGGTLIIGAPSGYEIDVSRSINPYKGEFPRSVYIGVVGAGAEVSAWLGGSYTFPGIRLGNLPSTEGFVKELAKIVCGVK